MTDFDADEPVPPLAPKRRFRLFSSDRFLGWSGAVLALSAAFFPWYVFFNEDQFELKYNNLITSRDLPERAGRAVVNASPSAIGDNDNNTVLPKQEDQIITGTVPEDKSEASKTKTDQAGTEQPFPSDPVEFRLLHVVNGKAMIEDKNGIYMVEAGSELPDLSRVATLEERDGKWVIITDKGTVYDASGKSK